MQLARFPKNDIISLVGNAPRYDLGESVGPDLRLAALLDATDLDEMTLGYGTVAGDPKLRKAIAEAYDVDADDVIVTVGGIHALFLIAFILCNRGDEAVAASPLFPQARNALDVVGANVHTLRLTFDRGYQLDPADLREYLSPATKLVSLASPQNPSGVAIPPHIINEILAMLEEVNPQAYLLIDETYREAVYGDNPVARSAAALSPKIISVTSLSKCHGAPGLRLGWVITRDPALREQLLLGKFNTVISCSPLCETLALSVLTQSESIIAERRRILSAGRTATAEWVQENRELVEWVAPDAGAICCVRLKPAVFDNDAVSRFYNTLASGDTRVANGSWFGDEVRVFRLGFGLLPLPDLQVALNALTKALKQTAHTNA